MAQKRDVEIGMRTRSGREQVRVALLRCAVLGLRHETSRLLKLPGRQWMLGLGGMRYCRRLYAGLATGP